MSVIVKISWRMVIGIIVGIIVVLCVTVLVFLNLPRFGRLPQGERLERIKRSPHYKDGSFQNLHPTQQITSDKGRLQTMWQFLTSKPDGLYPKNPIPVIKTDLKNLPADQDVMVWFGHSSYLLQLSGKRVLVDPVFCMAAPVSFINKPFKGTDIYKPDDMPDIDYLIISHDHWDHLDYSTIMQLKDRIGKVICPLGVGEHFEYWGFNKEKLIELDWQENASLDNGFAVYCLPARHFSGRGLSPNQSLWASFLLETPSCKVYVGGDSGYDTHFEEIGWQFPDIDLAILENGQYNEDWRYIHTMPQSLGKVAKDLNARRIVTVHHSKYALARHPWNEPLKNEKEMAENGSLSLIVPIIGEVFSISY